MVSSTSTRKAVSPARARRGGVGIAVAAQPGLFCEVLSRQLDEEPSLVVVGRASDEDHIGKMLAKENPQVLLFDYEGLGPNVEGAVQRLHRSAPGTRILVLSTRSGDETVERILRSGASGLFGKQLEFSSLVHAIQVVAGGRIWARPSATALALERMTRPSSAGGSKSDLTKREYEVADACSRGLRNKEIAKLLHISEKTVKGHLNNIFRKLQVNNRFALGLYIREPTELKT
jgi:DNA-binding NarL/FixJ family response regulator